VLLLIILLLTAMYCVLVLDRLLDAEQKHSEDYIKVKGKAAIHGQIF
jgi:hypothetical protein